MVPSRRPDPMDGRWVPPGESVEISGIVIEDGMIYVGRSLPRAGRDGPEPSLIDPHRPVSAYEQPHWTLPGLGARPSYMAMTPSNRLSYLRWLAAGRENPDEPGNATLFLFGLERRILRDLAGDLAGSPEAPLLADELARLLRVYRQRPLLNDQIAGLLVWLRLHLGDAMGPPPSPTEFWYAHWSQATTRIRFGALAAQGAPVPGWIARQVVEGQIGRKGKGAITEEFEEAFGALYEARYPTGPFATPRPTPARYRYRPASMAFTQEETCDLGAPEASFADADWRAIGWMIVEAEETVVSLHKALRRSPGARGLLAYAGLPARQVAGLRDRALAPLVEAAEAALGHRSMAPIEARLVARVLEPSGAQEFGLTQWRMGCYLLGALGYGLEPDPGQAPARLRKPGVMVLLREPKALEPRWSETYGRTCEMVAMLGEVAQVDGPIGPRSQALLARQLDRLAGGDARLLSRLNAHLVWRMECRLAPQATAAAMAKLPQEYREFLAREMVTIAVAEGEVTPGARAVLLKRYRALGLHDADLYAAIHLALTGGADEPVTVIAPTPGRPGFAISARPPAGVKLDADRMDRTRRETEEASATLLKIAVESEEPLPLPPPTPAPDEGPLDALHQALLARLLAQSLWPRADAEALAREFGIGLAAAIDTINEAALDQVDEYAIEGDDPLEVNADAAKGLLT